MAMRQTVAKMKKKKFKKEKKKLFGLKQQK